MNTMSDVTFQDYEAAFKETDITEDGFGESFAVLGLSGEIGELLTEIKKNTRGDVGDKSHEDSLCEELGDCLWYLTLICKQCRTSLSDVAECDDFESLDALGLPDSKEKIEELASKLVVENGKFVGALNNKGDIKPYLHSLLTIFVCIARLSSISMCKVASQNIEKTEKRFSKNYEGIKFFDDDFPIIEQFPRKLVVEIRQEQVGETTKAMLFIDGVMYGDPLDDNISGEEDFFRYHDVFHMSYAAHLWWSPAFRALLNKKRRSDPDTNNNQDGARARLMEEGLTHFIFRYGKDNNFFKGKKDVRVSSSVLNIIEAMVKGYEVQDRPLSLWNDAIINAFDVFSKVKDEGGGKITIDMENRKLMFESNKNNNRPAVFGER